MTGTPISYGYNGVLAQYGCGGQNCPGMPLAQFVAPASTVLLVEEKINGPGNPSGADFVTPGNEANDQKASSQIAFSTANGNDGHPDLARHDQATGSLEYVAADGHVKFVKAAYVDGVSHDGPWVSVNNLGNNLLTYNPQ